MFCMKKFKSILLYVSYALIYVILLIVWQHILLYDTLPKECFSFEFHRKWTCPKSLILLQDYIYIYLWIFIFIINSGVYFFSHRKNKKRNIWYTNFLISFLCFIYIAYSWIFNYFTYLYTTCHTSIWWLWMDSKFCMWPFVFLEDYKILIFPIFLIFIFWTFFIYEKKSSR